MARDKVNRHVVQLRLTHDEVEAKLESYARRLAAMDGRAGVLIASAAIAATLLTSLDGDGWLTAAVVCILAAAVAGAAALAPAKGLALEPRVVKKNLYNRTEARALLWLIDAKIILLELNEKRLRRRAMLLRIGFVLLAVAIAFAVLSTIGLSITVEWSVVDG